MGSGEQVDDGGFLIGFGWWRVISRFGVGVGIVLEKMVRHTN